VAAIPIKGRAAKTGYDRERFGSPWVDVDKNGCDTRNDVLARDLTQREEDGCRVLSGRLQDPYTGTMIPFERGASEVDIDHVVALGNAWVTGAAYWSEAERVSFANDPLNLIAVSHSANRAKGDGDAATWLPPDKGFRCAFVARQIAVKSKHRLWMTAAERAAIERVLGQCPDEVAPASDPTPDRQFGRRRAATPGSTSPAAQRDATPEVSAEVSVKATANKLVKRYRTCADAKAAGAGPFEKGVDPEYALYRDADNDGFVCE